MTLRGKVAAAIVLVAASGVGLASGARGAVFGTDDRGAIPPRHKSLNRSIGLFFNVKARTVCSAFCVADDAVATASHCIYRTSGEAPLDPADFRFGPPNMPANRQAKVAGADNGTAANNVLAGNTQLNVKPPIDASQDWALVRLDRPACRGAVLPVVPAPAAEIAERARTGQIFHAAFHRDRLPWRLLYAAGCKVAPTFAEVGREQIERDFRRVEQLLLHRCGTGGASSGSPLLADTPDGPVVIGINVGTYVQSRVVLQDGAVTFRSKPEAIANTAVNAAAFADAIASFARAPKPQRPVSRSSRATSSGESGSGASTAAPVRLLRQSSQPVSATNTSGVPQSSNVERSNGGRRSTNVP